MAVARAGNLQALHTTKLPVEQTALVIGGGVAGLTAALSLAGQGFPVHLVERTAELGGNLRQVHFLWNQDGQETDPQTYLAGLIERVETDPQITVHRKTEFESLDGFKGNFTSTLRRGEDRFTIRHGAVIVATGGVEYKGHEYGYGSDPRILTQQELGTLLARTKDHEGLGVQLGRPVNNVVMIQCVGPAERYCGRICCTTALQNAQRIKALHPHTQVTIIYRDIRTFGFKERLYTQARQAGVLFVRYDFERKPEVTTQADHLTVRVWDPALGKSLSLRPDLLVLSTPIVPSAGARELATKLKVSTDMDGFFLEAHVKLRPVDFSSEGIFMAGLAHYPKFLDESIIQAQAAAARATTVLAQETMTANARVAVVEQSRCVGCLTCVRVCPYGVPQVTANLTGVGAIVGAAQIEAAICQGCGICVAECPARAIQLLHYTDVQVMGKLDALFQNEDILEGV